MEQGQYLLLELVEFRLEDRDETPSLLEPVSLQRHEQVEDALRAGGTALEFLGVDRQHLDLLARHGATDLALEQSLDEKRRRSWRTYRVAFPDRPRRFWPKVTSTVSSTCAAALSTRETHSACV